jgi:hypothetical protein
VGLFLFPGHHTGNPGIIREINSYGKLSMYRGNMKSIYIYTLLLENLDEDRVWKYRSTL